MNTTETYTAGPWLVSEGCPDHGIVSRCGKLVAMVTTDEDCPVEEGERLANARLVAAAPQLLEALEVAVDVMRDNHIDESMASEFDRFTDAIAAAGGSGEGGAAGGLAALFEAMAEAVMNDDDGFSERAYGAIMDFAARLSPDLASRLSSRVDATDGCFYMRTTG